jgi:hypothetical protein
MKKKVLFREFILEIYTDGNVKMDGLDEFFNKRQLIEIMKMLGRLSAKIIFASFNKK